MKRLTTKLLAVAVGCLVSMGAWAQTTTVEFDTQTNSTTDMATQYAAGNMSDGNSRVLFFRHGGSNTGVLTAADDEFITNKGGGKLSSTSNIGNKLEAKNYIRFSAIQGDVITLYWYHTSTMSGKQINISDSTNTTSYIDKVMLDAVDGSTKQKIFAAEWTATATGTFYISSNNSMYACGIKFRNVVTSPVISSFTAAGVEATIDQTAKTITAELPFGTDLTNLTPVVTLGGSATGYSPAGAQDFSKGSVNYVASDGTAANDVTYAVTLTAAATANSDKDLTNITIGGKAVTLSGTTGIVSFSKASDISALAVSFDIPATATADFTSGNTFDFTSGSLTITVTAQDNSTAAYTLTVTQSDKATIAYLVNETLSANDTKIEPALAAAYDVTVIPATGTDLSLVSGYDLVVMVEAPKSSNTFYLAMGPAIGTMPILNFKGYMFGKTGWPAGAGQNDPDNTKITVSANYKSHPLFSGVTFDTDSVTLLNSLSGNGIQSVSDPAHSIVATEGTSAQGAILEYNNGTDGSNKMITIAISNDDFANVSDACLKIIDNAVQYLLDATARFIPATSALVQTTISGISYTDGVVHNANGVALQIYNAAGKLVAASASDIDMNNFAAGMYVVRSTEGTLKLIR